MTAGVEPPARRNRGRVASPAPPHPHVRNALDFARLVDGQAFVGNPEHGASWHGFGHRCWHRPMASFVSVRDDLADEPIGAIASFPRRATRSSSTSGGTTWCSCTSSRDFPLSKPHRGSLNADVRRAKGLRQAGVSAGSCRPRSPPLGSASPNPALACGLSPSLASSDPNSRLRAPSRRRSRASAVRVARHLAISNSSAIRHALATAWRSASRLIQSQPSHSFSHIA
jgi:hypothetical protein